MSELTSRNLVSAQDGLILRAEKRRWSASETGRQNQIAYVMHTDVAKMKNDVRVALELRLRELDAFIDAEADKGVGAPTPELRALEVACALDGDLENADSCVDRLAGEHLLKVQREDVGLVHHRAEDTMNGVANERR